MTMPARRHTDPRTTTSRLSIGEPGLRIIRYYDTFSAEPYLHRKGYHAIGYGHRIRGLDGVAVVPPITRALAEELLRREDLPMLELYLNATARVTLAQHEFDALCSLLFDVGIRAFERSELRAHLNAGDRPRVIDDFLRFDQHAFGEPPNGDTRQRRRAECKLFTGPRQR